MIGFIFVGTNFRGLKKNDAFVGFKICGPNIFLHNSYRKSLFCGFSNLWIEPSTKTTKIGTPQKLSHSQYIILGVISIIFALYGYERGFWYHYVNTGNIHEDS